MMPLLVCRQHIYMQHSNVCAMSRIKAFSCHCYRAAVGADADEEDDEATLDEEAALDAAAGRDVKVGRLC